VLTIVAITGLDIVAIHGILRGNPPVHSKVGSFACLGVFNLMYVGIACLCMEIRRDI
jgi:hypothetical protein